MGFPSPPSRAVGAQREGRDGVATNTQGSRPVLFYVAPSGANSNRSNPIQTIQTKIQTKTKTKTKTKFKPNSNHSNPNSNRSNPIRTQIQTVRTHLEPQLEIHISSHAARDSEGGSNSRGYRHDELNNQLPSVLFRFSTHRL